MKISTILAAAVALVCLLDPAGAEEQASIHLRVHNDKDVCYITCPAGQFCQNDGKKTCRKPKGKECFNPSTGFFNAKGCDPGFKCSHGKCVYA